VEIDQARKNQAPVGVYRPFGINRFPAAGTYNPAGLDQDFSPVVKAPVGIDQCAPGDPQVNFHSSQLLSRNGRLPHSDHFPVR
jgi:hypothetical protein